MKNGTPTKSPAALERARIMVEVTDEVRRAAMEYLTEIIRIHHPDSKPVEAIRDDHPALLAFARIYQRGKLEGARLAIEAAVREARDRADADDIRALSPAKIVREG